MLPADWPPGHMKNISSSAKRLLLAASSLLLLCAGCSLFAPPRVVDSLDNAATQSWVVTADFASGMQHTYEPEPETFFDFGTVGRHAPVLTKLTAATLNPPTVTHTLSTRDIAKLRRVSPGGLTLVLYDDGITCLSPALKRAFEDDVLNHPYTRQEYFRLLRARKDQALQWTREILAGY